MSVETMNVATSNCNPMFYQLVWHVVISLVDVVYRKKLHIALGCSNEKHLFQSMFP